MDKKTLQMLALSLPLALGTITSVVIEPVKSASVDFNVSWNAYDTLTLDVNLNDSGQSANAVDNSNSNGNGGGSSNGSISGNGIDFGDVDALGLSSGSYIVDGMHTDSSGATYYASDAVTITIAASTNSAQLSINSMDGRVSIANGGVISSYAGYISPNTYSNYSENVNTSGTSNGCGVSSNFDVGVSIARDDNDSYQSSQVTVTATNNGV